MSKQTGRTNLPIALACSITLLAGLVGYAGCSSPSENESKTEGKDDHPTTRSPIRVLVVDDEPLAESIERQWKAASEGEIQVKIVSASYVDALTTETSSADVLIYPSAWLGELVERNLLIPISSRVLNDPKYDRADVLPLDQTSAVTWGEKTYAFSFGVPQLVLMYRRDVFDRLKLAPPETWDEYQQVIDRLSAEVGENKMRQAAVEPLAPGWASQMLLARAAAYARQRSRYWTLFDYATMEPMINGSPFQRALKEMVAAANKEKLALTLEEARQDLLAGNCLMAITWPSGGDAADGGEQVGFAPLPGARTIYNSSSANWESFGDDQISRVPLFGLDGRLGSVLTSSASPRNAFNFLAWLTSGTRSATICSRSSHTAPFRESHKSKTQLWVGDSTSGEGADEYFSSVNSMKRETLTLGALRIPGREEYVEALDQAVIEALGGTDPTIALNTAAARWREITERIGVDKQRAAYKRSLGIE